MGRLNCRLGRLELKNPVIAAAGEHMIEASGVERAVRAGAGAVVVKSTNESKAAKDQLLRAEYIALGSDWRPAKWGADAPMDVTLASRSGWRRSPSINGLLKRARLTYSPGSMTAS